MIPAMNPTDSAGRTGSGSGPAPRAGSAEAARLDLTCGVPLIPLRRFLAPRWWPVWIGLGIVRALAASSCVLADQSLADVLTAPVLVSMR